MLSDGELLRRYVEDGSQAAFTELVQRHLNLVYLTALRLVGRNAHTADDVTQSVFTDLARKAGSLRNRPNLAGWLYTGTRFAAADAVRAERRRRAHEQETPIMPEANLPPNVPADRIEPFLDEVMDLLPPQDRDVILLHFFEGHSFPEVGAVLSLSADAARMRANRALERLRAGFAQRGIASSAVALTTSLSAQSALAAAAPTALAIAGRAVSRAGASGPGGSALGRWTQAARLSPALPWTGVAILAGIAGLAVATFHPAAAIPTAATPDDVAVEAIKPGTDPLPAAVQAAEPAALPAAAAEGVSGRQELAPPAESGALSFGDLSEPERHILKALWQGQQGLPRRGERFALHVGKLAVNFADFSAGRDLLLARGWIRPTVRPQTVCLTAPGIRFCAAQDAAIGAYPAFYPSHPGAAGGKKTPGF
jgi:RNA polymerase sigma factor (sigma-70 family)